MRFCVDASVLRYKNDRTYREKSHYCRREKCVKNQASQLFVLKDCGNKHVKQTSVKQHKNAMSPEANI
jgi:hypothetical protein